MTVLEFPPDQLVAITDRNTAHALDDERHWLCSYRMPGDLHLSALLEERATKMTMTWAQTRDPTHKPWPAWPCQTCAGRLIERGGPRIVKGSDGPDYRSTLLDEMVDDLLVGGEPFMVTRLGEPVAVLMSFDAYERMKERVSS